MKFDTDEYKNDRLMLIERIVRKMRDNEIVYDASLFQNVLYVYTESQQWGDVATILRSQQSTDHCKPNLKTMKYLRSNLVYCFQNSTRLDVLDAIESFEQRFFSYQQRREQEQSSKKNKSTSASKIAEESIEEGDLEADQMSKKVLRREARKNIS